MTIILTDQEAEAVLQFVDIGLKREGLRALAATNAIVNKINAARISKQNEKPPVPAPDPAGVSG